MLTAAQVLAQNNFGNTRTGGLAGPMGLFIILALAAVTVLLIRNMNARLRRLPPSFADAAVPAEASRAEAAVLDPTDGGSPQESSPKAAKAHQQHRNG
ncbi:hypothetical protein AWW66_12605 [Micromonospora rosaria]|uniref:Uncharacterized protein n=1 Tax=Micromonospora rosaria TaxID=47874 RepID=A0A136PTD5_9ACTN|nr:hypothetical protein [Micromonospora rosaria]KXK61663.1 hypothetical protein AWW66_12605 [Micromonospora rosaria]